MGNVIDMNAVRDNRERMEAHKIAESALHIFEHIFGNSPLMSAALAEAKAYAIGAANKDVLSEHRHAVQKIVSKVVAIAVASDSEFAWQLHPGIMAAYSILECMQEEIDISEVKRRADEAYKYFDNQSILVR